MITQRMNAVQWHIKDTRARQTLDAHTLLDILGASRPLPPSKHSGGRYQYVPAPCTTSQVKQVASHTAAVMLPDHALACNYTKTSHHTPKNNPQHNAAHSTHLTRQFHAPPLMLLLRHHFRQPKIGYFHLLQRSTRETRDMQQCACSCHLAAVYQHIGGLEVVVDDSIFLRQAAVS